MMRVSTRGEYGVRVMVDLARHYGKGPRSLTDISSDEQLPLPYLEQLVKLLRDKGLIVSTRGAHGGYQLSRDPLDIRMSEVIRVLEGPIAPMICATEGEMGVICDRLDGCSTKYLWARVRDAITGTLDGISLGDLLAQTDGAHAAYPGAQLVTISPPRSRVRRTAPAPAQASTPIQLSTEGP